MLYYICALYGFYTYRLVPQVNKTTNPPCACNIHNLYLNIIRSLLHKQINESHCLWIILDLKLTTVGDYVNWHGH